MKIGGGKLNLRRVSVRSPVSYDDCQVKETDYGVTVTVSGTYSGYWLDDNDDLDDPVIDLEITVYLPRCAGSVSFEEPQVDVVGTLREDDVEEEESEQPAAAIS